MFQHRHYAAIAALLSQLEASDSPEHIRNTFAVMFKRDNPRFNWDRFIAAANGAPTHGRDRRALNAKTACGINRAQSHTTSKNSICRVA